MAEELTEYLLNHDIRTAYIHSDVASLDRIKIINDLRTGVYDVLVGVNLLREGLDLPEVSLVAILDADKEAFFEKPSEFNTDCWTGSKKCQWKSYYVC